MKRFGIILLVCLLWAGCLQALAEDAQDPHALRLYYNPDGGVYCHLDMDCPSVSAKYLPLKPLTDAEQAQIKALCPYCFEASAPFFTVSGGSAGMPNLQVDVYETALKFPEWEDDPVYRIHITDGDRPDHAFSGLLFPSIEGGDGLAPLVRIQDLNFDGYPDLKALRAQGASNEFSTFFLYDPMDGQFHHEPILDELSAYALYPEQKYISNFVHDSAATSIRELYRVSDDGKPMLCRRVSVLSDAQSQWQKIRILVTSYDPDGAEAVLMDEVREPFAADDADYQQSEQKWLALFYEGIPEAVVKGDLGQ